MFIVLVTGISFPRVGLGIKELGASTVLVMLVMFLSGTSISPGEIFNELKSFRLILLSFAIVYVIAPLLGYLGATIFFPNDPAMLVGIMIMASQSSTLVTGFVFTGLAGGNRALALVITIINNLASVFATPVILKMALSESGVGIDTLQMIGRIAMVILLPVVFGQIACRIFTTGIAKIKPVTSYVSQCCVLTIMLMGVSQAAKNILGDLNVLLLLAMAMLCIHLILNVVAFALSRLFKLRRDSSIAITLCSSQKTLPAGFYIATHDPFAAISIAALPIVIYHSIQLIFGTILYSWLAKKSATNQQSEK